MLDALVIAPHPDDAELGMAGGILKMQAAGMRVGVLDLTTGEPTPHGTPELRRAETAAATAVLGLEWRQNLGLPNRMLEPTLENRAALAGVIRVERPRWLFAPYWEDAHPDHTAATKLVDDARFWAKLSKTEGTAYELPGERHHPQRVYHYYCVHLKLAPRPAFVLDISDVWPQKLASIRAYESQFITGRPAPTDPSHPAAFIDQLTHEAAYWGKTIGAAYGEPYASREPLGLSGFGGLV
ncbi:MAG: bacillithiol biosynthesis deacetylase BshB1 [Planctomycetota bacterium]